MTSNKKHITWFIKAMTKIKGFIKAKRSIAGLYKVNNQVC